MKQWTYNMKIWAESRGKYNKINIKAQDSLPVCLGNLLSLYFKDVRKESAPPFWLTDFTCITAYGRHCLGLSTGFESSLYS